MKLNIVRIEVIMAEKRLTKSKCAELCKISRQHLSTILRRESCEPATAGRLADGLGVPVSEIVKE